MKNVYILLIILLKNSSLSSSLICKEADSCQDIVKIEKTLLRIFENLQETVYIPFAAVLITIDIIVLSETFTIHQDKAFGISGTEYLVRLFSVSLLCFLKSIILYNFIEIKINIIAENPFWIKKSEYYFDASESLSTDNKKYAYRYAYRYANGMRNRSIMNSYIKACNFELKIFGSVLNPQIIIGGYEYLINDYLENGEYIIVDSLKRTVTKIMNDGTAVNIFDSREKKRSVFQKIRSGRSLISWSGKFDFMLTLYEERAEPQWH